MDVVFTPVDLESSVSTCIAFRKDAWIISHGTEEGFSKEEAVRWFRSIKEESPFGFLHIWYEGIVVGQLEFMSNIKTSDNQKAGYVNLFYLTPEYRGIGLGQIIHDYVINELIKAKCIGAMLRYIPGNARAENFYLKNGWYKSGDAEPKRGQLMRKDFIK
ncbi:GNAT family N-acetyltransferase [Enterovibrio makurazakiensis]|uniref:GNAT family N-acetyltransferase n=1 Tax=Enterovibrio makurazakiensis TaxID=2910232 RepID=UPI003D1EC17B